MYIRCKYVPETSRCCFNFNTACVRGQFVKMEYLVQRCLLIPASILIWCTVWRLVHLNRPLYTYLSNRICIAKAFYIVTFCIILWFHNTSPKRVTCDVSMLCSSLCLCGYGTRRHTCWRVYRLSLYC